jgi:hypothetical protein
MAPLESSWNKGASGIEVPVTQESHFLDASTKDEVRGNLFGNTSMVGRESPTTLLIAHWRTSSKRSGSSMPEKELKACAVSFLADSVAQFPSTHRRTSESA